jgi:hypothetical protein
MSFTCPICSMTSHNPSDEKERYCGNCHLFIGDVELYFDIDKLREIYQTKGKEELKWTLNERPPSQSTNTK